MCGGSLAPYINLSEQVTETELFEFDFEFFEFDIDIYYKLEYFTSIAWCPNSEEFPGAISHP